MTGGKRSAGKAHPVGLEPTTLGSEVQHATRKRRGDQYLRCIFRWDSRLTTRVQVTGDSNSSHHHVTTDQLSDQVREATPRDPFESIGTQNRGPAKPPPVLLLQSERAFQKSGTRGGPEPTRGCPAASDDGSLATRSPSVAVP